MAVIYGGLFALALLITVNVVPWIVRLSVRRGFVDYPGERKIHTQPVPYGGGLAVALGFGLTMGLALVCVYLQERHGVFRALPQTAAAYVPNVFLKLNELLTLVGLGYAILVLGMLDDRYKLPVWVRLAVEGAAALLFALNVEALDLFRAGRAVSVAVTVVWMVGVTNMFNLLDHFDGLSSGVFVVSGLCFFAVAVITEQLFIACVTATLVGATLGFFLFNRPPANIFLGDGGSLFLGFMMAALTVLFTFYRSGYRLYTYAVPLAILAVPIFDTARVVLIRLREGRSIFQGDTNHIAHRLTALGLRPWAVLAVVLGLTLVSGIGAVLLYSTDDAGALAILAQLALVFLIVTTLEASGRRQHES